MRSRSGWYARLLLIPGLLLVVLLLIVPLVNVLQFSFGEQSMTSFTGGGFSGKNYLHVFTDPFLRGVFVRTFVIAAITVVLSTALAIPVSYFIVRSGPRLRSGLTIAILFPLLTGSVVLSIGWLSILGPSGIVSQLLQGAGVLDHSLEIVQTPTTVILIMMLIDLPIIVLSIQGAMDSIDSTTEKASKSLGASQFRTFSRVIIPQAMPGIVVGTSLAFILTVNAYATPRLIGGDRVQMVAPTIYSTVTRNSDWPQGSALAITVVITSLILTGLYSRLMTKRYDKWRRLQR